MTIVLTAQSAAAVADDAFATLCLPRAQNVAPTRKRVLGAAKLNLQWRALEPQDLTEGILQVATVLCRNAFRLTAVHDNQRRETTALMCVAQPDGSSANRRWGVCIGRALKDIIQPRSRMLFARSPVSLQRRTHDL
jgi:hypothetical protein